MLRVVLDADVLVPISLCDTLLRLARVELVAFAFATVADDWILELEPSMTNDTKNRHVLAAGVAGGADLIVTRNVRHFPASACEVHGIEAVHPDDFLLRQFRRDPDMVRDAVVRQIADLTNPPMSLADLLGVLRTWVPRFVGAFALDAGIT